MYNLTYDLLVDRVIKKNALIFSLIANNPAPTNMDELILQSGFSKRTILNYISSFNIECPFGLTMALNMTNEIILNVKDPSAISQYLNKTTEENPLFYILEYIYSDSTETLESLADKLYLSESTIKRYLAHLKKVIKKYDLRLQFTPTIEIVGNEATIRYFYFKYFRYVHDASILPVRNDQVYSVYNTITSIIDDSGFALNIDYPRAVYWTIIVEQRVKQGYRIQLPESTLNIHRHSKSFLRFKKAFLSNFKTNPILGSLSESELIYAFLIRLDTLIYESNSAFFMDDYISDLFQFENIVSNFLSKRKLHPGLYYELKISLQAFLLNITFLTDLSPFFQQLDIELHKQMEHGYPDILNDWFLLLNKSTIPFSFLKDIAVSLTLITVSNLQFSVKKKLKILFSFSGDASSINYYKSIALKIVPRETEVLFVFNRSLSDNYIKNLSIDICVINFVDYSKISICPVIKLSPIPIEAEWAALLSYLYER